MSAKIRAGINADYHPEVINSVKALRDLGVFYHGDDQWVLPDGAIITKTPAGPGFARAGAPKSETHWVLRLADGRTFRVWADEPPVSDSYS